jgi:hypothetical protein
MQAGQNPDGPLTQLNSRMGYGAMAGLNSWSNPESLRMMLQTSAVMREGGFGGKRVWWFTVS